jgi:DNA adenine methylase
MEGKGLFQRQGGKWRQRKNIFARFPPTSSYDTYVEPFLGAGHIALEAPIVKKMIAGDTDKMVYNIFKWVNEIDAETIKQLDFRKSQKRFEELKKSKPTSSLGNLYKSLYLVFHSFPTNINTYYAGSTTSGKRFLKNIDKFKEVISHYKILNKDYKYLIKKYDSPTTFFYLDPPYYKTDTSAYQTGGIDHDELASILKEIKGKFLLSNNDDPYIKNLYRGFHITKFISKQTDFSTGNRNVNEILISNY